MRIGIASSGLGHVARGVEAWAEELFCALRERGEDVVLYSGAGPRRGRAAERVVGCWERSSEQTRLVRRVIPKWLGWRMGLGSGYGIEQTTFALRLLGWLRRDRMDVLHVQDPLVALIVQRARALGLVRTRAILAHGTEEPLSFLKKIEFVQHLAPSHAEEAREGGVWGKGWVTIPNFIDTERFMPSWTHGGAVGFGLRAELGIPEDARVVLTVAAIKRRHKRIDYLLEEFASLLKSDEAMKRRSDGGDGVYLVIAGGWEGSETDELITQGKRMLADRVRFLVRFPRERMIEVYRMADLFVLCSLKEMMPMALLEATASGLPCLVHRGSVGEWMIGPGGEAIDMSGAGELSGAMERWLGCPELIRGAGEQARRHCVEHFGRDRVVEQILNYYRYVCGCGTAIQAVRDKHGLNARATRRGGAHAIAA